MKRTNYSFELSWSGTKHGQGMYHCESKLLEDGRPLFAHESSRKYVFWYHAEDKIWTFTKRSQLDLEEPSMFAYCNAEPNSHPADMAGSWKTLTNGDDDSDDPWKVATGFVVKPVQDLPGGGRASPRKKRRRDSTRQNSRKKRRRSPAPSPEPAPLQSEGMTQEDERGKKALDDLDEFVRMNTVALEKFEDTEGTISDPRSERDLVPTEDRLKKLEEEEQEELQSYIDMAKSIREMQSTAASLFKDESPNHLRKQEISVLYNLNMLGEATVKKLREFLKKYRKENMWIKGYGYISMKGKKERLVKQAKRVLRQLEREQTKT